MALYKGHEKDCIEELRARMRNTLSSEMYEDTLVLYRFLKARDFDVDKAEIMLKNHLIFRKVHKVDTILLDFRPKEAFKHFQNSYFGEDNEGNIVLYAPTGNIDPKDVLECFKIADYYRHWIWVNECYMSKLREPNANSNNNDRKIISIIDLENLKLANVLNPTGVKHVVQLAEHFQDNFPELLKKMLIINAPSYYVLGFSVVKRVLAKEVLRKISVYGASGWKDDLLKLVDADVLPAFLGGNRTDPDGNPLCKTFINHAGKVPLKYYLSKEDRSFKDKTRIKRITISPGRKCEIPVDIPECNNILKWEFEVESKDIQFGLYFKESETQLKDVIPLFKYETPDGTEENSHKCEWIGTYVIVFDNTQSRFTHKEVAYCITVDKPAK